MSYSVSGESFIFSYMNELYISKEPNVNYTTHYIFNIWKQQIKPLRINILADKLQGFIGRKLNILVYKVSKVMGHLESLIVILDLRIKWKVNLVFVQKNKQTPLILKRISNCLLLNKLKFPSQRWMLLDHSRTGRRKSGI